MNECLFRHKNNVKRSLLCKKNIKITKYTKKYKSVENNKINFYELIRFKFTNLIKYNRFKIRKIYISS